LAVPSRAPLAVPVATKEKKEEIVAAEARLSTTA
jgi:hypothetical protein